MSAATVLVVAGEAGEAGGAGRQAKQARQARQALTKNGTGGRAVARFKVKSPPC